MRGYVTGDVAEGSDPAVAGPGRAWMLAELLSSDPMLMVPLSDAELSFCVDR